MADRRQGPSEFVRGAHLGRSHLCFREHSCDLSTDGGGFLRDFLGISRVFLGFS